MGTVKKNPNDLQLKEAKTTRPGESEKSQQKTHSGYTKQKTKESKGQS